MESILLNLVPSGSTLTCSVSQHDVGRVIRIRLYDGPLPYVLQSGDYCTISVRKPNGEFVSDYLECTEGESFVDLVTTDEMDDCIGKNKCEVRLINGTKNIGSMNFFMDVEEGIGDVEPLPPPEPPAPPRLNTPFAHPGSDNIISCSGMVPKLDNGDNIYIDYSKDWTVKHRSAQKTTSTSQFKSYFIMGTAKSREYYRHPSFEIQRGDPSSVWGSVSSNGTSWNSAVVSGNLTELAFIPFEWYDFEVSYKASNHEYKLKITRVSTNTVIYEGSGVLDVPVYQPDFNTYPMCFGGNAIANNGTYYDYEQLMYDLTLSYIENDGVVIWGNKET